MAFPVWIEVGSWRLHPHLVFQLSGYAAGIGLYRRRHRIQHDHLDAPLRWSIVTAAVVGALIGSHVLAWLEDPRVLVDPTHLTARLAATTLVGALLGGWLAVELEKRRLGIRERTGDMFALPLAVGIAIGRVGCFLTGVSDGTFGVATMLPWGVDAGDGVLRHPAPLYESAFMLLVASMLPIVERRTSRGTPFRFFLSAYLLFRLVIDGLKPGPRLVGMTSIQWACATALLVLALAAWHHRGSAAGLGAA